MSLALRKALLLKSYTLSLLLELIQLIKKMSNASRFCVSSLRRGHANLLCIVPILADDLFRGSNCSNIISIYTAKLKSAEVLCRLKKKIKTEKGAVRESNPRPLPPEGRIIPLDQRPMRSTTGSLQRGSNS